MNLRLLAACAALLASAASAEPFFQSGLVFPLQPQHAHSSTVAECPNGDLIACWFQGSGERTAKDVALFGARLRKGETAWSAPFPMADTPDFPDCNPVLFVDAHGDLRLFWIAVLSERWEDSLLRMRVSSDYQGDGPPVWRWQDLLVMDPGDGFEAALKAGFDAVAARHADPTPQMKWLLKREVPRILKDAKSLSLRQRGWMTRCRPTTLASGRVLLPLYSDGYVVGLCGISDDGGATWRSSAVMPGAALNQPSLVQKKDGTVVAYFREEDDVLHRILRSESRDNGETWTVAEYTELPNPNASVEVLGLRDGRWLLVYNDTEQERESLVLSLSDDEGATWKATRPLERAAGGAFHYPFMIQTADGRVHVTYTHNPPGGAGKTIKHVALDPDWVLAGDEEK